MATFSSIDNSAKDEDGDGDDNDAGDLDEEDISPLNSWRRSFMSAIGFEGE